MALTIAGVMAIDASWTLYLAVILAGPFVLIVLLCARRRITRAWTVVLAASCLAATVAIQLAAWSGVD